MPPAAAQAVPQKTCLCCLDDFLPTSEVAILPCGHVYHEARSEVQHSMSLRPWLLRVCGLRQEVGHQEVLPPRTKDARYRYRSLDVGTKSPDTIPLLWPVQLLCAIFLAIVVESGVFFIVIAAAAVFFVLAIRVAAGCCCCSSPYPVFLWTPRRLPGRRALHPGPSPRPQRRPLAPHVARASMGLSTTAEAVADRRIPERGLGSRVVAQSF